MSRRALNRVVAGVPVGDPNHEPPPGLRHLNTSRCCLASLALINAASATPTTLTKEPGDDLPT